ncbi:hypothetical protein GH714_019943 [Hevea brasiliensis]|uniref:Uncharacterized protein n=1 Tax=Hevea brasiliensis TaxID=3981 RepID=A0A6A6LB22_HEVBR|nr:hypothetical protein GH714_019943 [Hevea brasiliensis]
MLGSLNSSSSHDQEEEEAIDLQYQLMPRASPVASGGTTSGFTSSANHMRQLLITCAELISQSDFSAAHRLISVLSANSSPYGDSRERLVHQFVKALSLRLNPHGAAMTRVLMNIANPSAAVGGGGGGASSVTASAVNAILEAIEVGQQAIHIIDFDIMHGVQWPPLMQALAERSSNNIYPPPMLRITGTGHDLNILDRTGDRLLKFAQSLGLKFQFHPLLLPNNDASSLPSAITLLPDEALAVNCVLYLHRLLKNDSRDLRIFLHRIKALNPKVVTIAEREANHNHPFFLQRFLEALEHYAALFDSLEATLPPNSRERLAVEQIWFGKEIMDIVAAEGEERRERHERFESWEMILRSAGFTNVPLSPFALSQAKLLLRLHYPSEGYHLQILNNSFFLGWQNHALFSVSSWH